MPYALKPTERPVLPPPPRETPGPWLESLAKARAHRFHSLIFYVSIPIVIGFILSLQNWIALFIGLAIGLTLGGMYAVMERQTIGPVQLLRDGVEVHASVVRSTGRPVRTGAVGYSEQYNYYFEVDDTPVVRTLSVSAHNQARHVNLPNDAPGIVLLVHPDDPWSPFVVPKEER
ncbi:MAG: hypothetical protein L6R28_02595 [Planctomycetes bacterium]|nr:hypothetical protein [Planctomycetota bacterium]